MSRRRRTRSGDAFESHFVLEVPRSADVLSPSNTSTPSLEEKRNKDSVSVKEKLSIWDDRSVSSLPDYEEHLTWPDDDEDGGGSSSKLFPVSENTKKLLQESFLKGVANPSRRQMREKLGDPRCSPPTRTCIPKLDKMVKDRMSHKVVKLDKSLARLQALCSWASENPRRG